MDMMLPPKPSSSQNNITILEDYTELLKSYGINEVISAGFYIQIGIIEAKQGWMLHIPIWDIQFKQLLDTVIPTLIKLRIPFLIPISNYVHTLLQAGLLGYKNLGKILIIFPQNEAILKIISKFLINETFGYKGPDIPTDFWLGNLVYTRYGSFNVKTYNEENYLVDNNGLLIRDEESIPPIIYNWVTWPFSEKIKSAKEETKFLNNKYLITKTVKPDVKGRVLLAIYYKGFLKFSRCIIKEGKKGMGVDKYGREMSDRLNWQNSIHENLKHLSIPKIIDFFIENNNTYLVLSYIRGKSLRDFSNTLSNGNSWEHTQKKNRVKILKVICEVTKIIRELHEKGYIHRDLNTENIIVNKKKKVWLIDMELTYDLEKLYPNPPFEIGTEGFMSPEQKKLLLPTIQQDIYSIGSILLSTLTGLSPYRLNLNNLDILKDNLLFFVHDFKLVKLIIDCLNPNPKMRPSTFEILKILERSMLNLEDVKPQISTKNKDFNIFISDLILSLSCPNMLNTEGFWTSSISVSENYIGNVRLDRTVYFGFRKGISGVLFTISIAKLAGFRLNKLDSVWINNYNILKDQYLTLSDVIPGLYKGCYGVAIGIQSLISANLLECSREMVDLIRFCFKHSTTNLDLADGISGYGIALLKCRSIISKDLISEKLNECITEICQKQLPNGSWEFEFNGKNIIITGFDRGIAGILWFLLSYVQIYNDKTIEKVALKGLYYLQQTAKRKDNSYYWNLTNTSAELHEFQNGGYHILLPFIKAYQITGNKIYRQIVENTLITYPDNAVADFATIEMGLAGLGEIYLESWNAFGNIEWLKRSEWIANVLHHSVYYNHEYKYWLLHDPYSPNADLLTGHSGILHFFLRFSSPNEVKHIFDPC